MWICRYCYLYLIQPTPIEIPKMNNKYMKVAAISLSVLLASCAGTTVAPNYVTEITSAVESRSDDDQVRDKYRNPIKTLAFFDVQPGMTVAEALPGGGWYSKILANYLGADGTLYGINYNDDMWARFGFFSEEAIKGAIERTNKFPEMINGFSDSAPKSGGFTFATLPADAVGTADRILVIRALHNLNRFESDAGTMSGALETMHKLLKDDGLVGVVQHRLSEDADSKGADGSRGYLKQSGVINAFEKAGFKLVKTSEINANKLDKPGPKDIVWRLPPSFNGSKDDAEKKAAMAAIGESDRMTLVFKKK